MRRAIVIALLLLSSLLSAEDIADFVNLGFSEDSRYFMFSQYGITQATLYADAYIVDTKRNAFVPSGAFSYHAQQEPIFNQDGRGALFTLLKDAQSRIDQYGIDHLNPGRPLYISINGSSDTIEFRDFQREEAYTVSLTQAQKIQNSQISSKFHIALTRTRSDGTQESSAVGSPSLYREHVDSYRIAQIILAPDERSLVFLVEKTHREGQRVYVRHMVETLYIDPR